MSSTPEAPDSLPVRIQHYTRYGTVVVEGPIDPSYMEGLSMNRLLTNFRPPARQKTALMAIAGLEPGLVFIARYHQEIVGYVTILRPDPYTRWLKHPQVLELGAVEVSRGWRRCYVGTALLSGAFSFGPLEDYIVITLEYCWQWDLTGARLDTWQYRQMLTGLFTKAGLVIKATDDPDITEHPANVLMARVGGNVPPEAVLWFENMLFEGGSGYG